MADSSEDPIKSNLISIVSAHPYQRYIQYISSADVVTEEDFQNMEVSRTFWIDRVNCHKPDGRRNAMAMFELFGSFSNKSGEVVRSDIIKRVELESILYKSVAQVPLGMRKIKLDEWCIEMKDKNQFPDELCIFALSRTYNRHTMILCKQCFWTTLEASEPMSVSDLIQAYHVHLVYLGCGMYRELKYKTADTKEPSQQPNQTSACIELPETTSTGIESITSTPIVDSVVLPSTSHSDHTYATPVTATQQTPPAPSHSGSNELVSDIPHSSDVISIPKHFWLHPTLHANHQDTDPVNMKGENSTELEIVKGGNDAQGKEITKGENVVDVDPFTTNIERLFEDTAQRNKCYVPLERLLPDTIKMFCPSARSPPIDPYSSLEDLGHSSEQSGSENEPAKNWNKLCSQPKTIEEPENYPPVTYSHTGYFMRERRSKRRSSNRPLHNVALIDYAKLFTDDLDGDKPKKTLKKPKVKPKPSSDRIAAQQAITQCGRPKHKPERPVLPVRKRFFRKDPVRSKPPHRRRFIKPDPEQSVDIDTETDPKLSTSNEDTTQEPPVPDVPGSDTKKYTFTTTQHGIKKHKTEHYFKCPRCGIYKSSVMKINEHYKRRHSALKCNKCTMTFTTPSGLSRHYYVHAAPRYPCPDCNRSFHFSSELKVHRNCHLQVKSHFCNMGTCNRGFMNKPDLLKHIREHDAKPLFCTRCDYTTKNPRLLKSHQAVHGNIKLYKCTYCQESFKYRTQLSRHREICKSKPGRSNSPDF